MISLTPKTIAILGASGKLGSSTLNALLHHNLHPASNIIALTSSHPDTQTWTSLSSTHNPAIQVRHANFNDPSTIVTALKGVDIFFLISTPKISLDFNNAPDGQGREGQHIAAIDAAVEAGVKWIVYSSLAFAFPSFQTTFESDEHQRKVGSKDDVGHSKAGVMRAHLRTERHLASLVREQKIKTTIIREGLYNESWPLYLGYFDIPGYLSMKERADGKESKKVVKLAGDGKICWTSIKDLGIGSAWILSRVGGMEEDGKEWLNRKLYLSTSPEQALSMKEVAALVSQCNTEKVPVEVEIVPSDEHIKTYVEKQGSESRSAVEWWVSTYPALEDGECLINDSTLGEILGKANVKQTPMEETVAEMLQQEAT